MVKNNLATAPAPHLHSPLSTPKIMAITLLSLLPAVLVSIYFFGTGLLWQFLISAVTAFLCQLLVGFLRHRSLYKSIGDLSYLVTAIILALTLPPLLPFFLTIIVTAFAILIVKECFGGLGMNIFNPAMAGFIFLLISAPAFVFNTHIAPAPKAYTIASLGETYEVIFNNESPIKIQDDISKLNHHTDKISENIAGKTSVDAGRPLNNTDSAAKKASENVDTASNAITDKHSENASAKASDKSVNTASDDITDKHSENTSAKASDKKVDVTSGASVDSTSGATWLESSKTARKSGQLKEKPQINYINGNESGYLYLSLSYVLGGLILLAFKIIFLRMVVSFFVALSCFVLLGQWLFPDLVLALDEQILLGGTMIGAFYIITDPVTNAGTARGRIVFAILCAFLIVLIRAFGSYSDSVAFAVLLSNAAAPLIDVLTHRRAYGYNYRKRSL